MGHWHILEKIENTELWIWSYYKLLRQFPSKKKQVLRTPFNLVPVSSKRANKFTFQRLDNLPFFFDQVAF